MKKIVIVLIASLASLVSSVIFAEAPVVKNVETKVIPEIITQTACIGKSVCVLKVEETS
jgi:hypothetical protein